LLMKNPEVNAMRRVVAYHSPYGHINGAVLDALDYWMVIRSLDASVELWVAGISRKDLEVVMKSRYDQAAFSWKGIHIGKTRLLFAGATFDRVLCGYSTLKRILPLARVERYHVLPTWLMHGDAGKGRIRGAGRDGVVFYLNPHQHDYRVREKRAYTKKLYLEGLRKPEHCDRAVLVNCVSAHKALDPSVLRAAVDQLEDNPTVRVLGHDPLYAKAGFELLKPPVTDLFQRYDRYLYLPAAGGYDENPRLMLESAWLGKEVIISGNLKPGDGARHKLEMLKSDPRQLLLEKDDLLVREFLDSPF